MSRWIEKDRNVGIKKKRKKRDMNDERYISNI